MGQRSCITPPVLVHWLIFARLSCTYLDRKDMLSLKAAQESLCKKPNMWLLFTKHSFVQITLLLLLLLSIDSYKSCLRYFECSWLWFSFLSLLFYAESISVWGLVCVVSRSHTVALWSFFTLATSCFPSLSFCCDSSVCPTANPLLHHCPRFLSFSPYSM